MVTKGFHYIKEMTWNELKRTANSVIKPSSRLIRLDWKDGLEVIELPDWAHEAYIFAFPDVEAPTPWNRYYHWRYEWDKLTQDIGERIVALEFDLLPTDKAYVVDRSHFADFQWKHSTNKQEAIRKYVDSRVKANKYHDSFRMPELIIQNPISLDRVYAIKLIQRQIVQTDNGYRIKYHYSKPSLQ